MTHRYQTKAQDPVTGAQTTGHAYDGITEYDNPLPGWWTWLFIGSIVFSVFYMIYTHCGEPGRSIHDQYAGAVAANLKQQFAELGELKPDRETLLKYVNDPRWGKVGEVVFKTHCVSCHGDRGEGKVGPNLCDDAWKNVRSVEDIAKIVMDGANGQAMPAWKTRLHANEMVLVASYVASLRGSNPPGAKPPEGNVIPAWK